MSCTLADISVVIPTRNEVDNIAGFLASLHPAVELIVVDASDDLTPDLVLSLRPQHTTIIRVPARIAQARQIGADAARGEWIIFSDADVCFQPGYFSYFADHISGDAFYGPKYSTAAHPYYNWVFTGGQRLLHRLGIPAASGSNMGMRRAVLDQVGGIRLDLPVNEDSELMMRVQRKGFHIAYMHALAVSSIDDRRLAHGAMLKMLHSVSRNALLFLNGYLPIPRRWLTHDWGYWSFQDAHRSDL